MSILSRSWYRVYSKGNRPLSKHSNLISPIELSMHWLTFAQTVLLSPGFSSGQMRVKANMIQSLLLLNNPKQNKVISALELCQLLYSKPVRERFNQMFDVYLNTSGVWTVKFSMVGTAKHPVYNQVVSIIDGHGRLLGTFQGSSTPNPYKPKNSQLTGNNAYPTVKSGIYPLKDGTHKGARALSVNNDDFVPTTAKNPNYPSQGSTANYIRIHKGDSDTWKGSAGCLTINPQQWESFLTLIPTNFTGLLVIP